MSRLIKFVGGIILGAVLGAGTYMVLTHEDEASIIDDAKAFVDNVIGEGRRAAEDRRTELESELGQRTKYVDS